MSVENEKKNVKLDRRQFLKVGAAGTVVGTAAAASFPQKVIAETAENNLEKTAIRHLDGQAIKVSPDYKRFDEENTVFSQAFTGRDFQDKLMGLLKPKYQETPGFRHVDMALEKAGWHVCRKLGANGALDTIAYGWDSNKPAEKKFKFASNKEATEYVKTAALKLGASLVGVCPVDERWHYSKRYDRKSRESRSNEFPFKAKSAIVMAVEMDYEGFSTAPAWTASAMAGKGYSDMAFISSSMAAFLNQIGSNAIASGNDTALSVPYGIAAGLGEAGRNGILVTYKYGPRVRLCKVFTDLELEYDKPISFGVREFCERCMRCADACPSESISKDVKPSFKTVSKYNNPGVERWAVKQEKCFEFWCKNGGDCGTCISSCPYNKPDFWHHRLVDKVSALMPGPVHSFMREMDILFGYGNTYDKKAVEEFWNSEDK